MKKKTKKTKKSRTGKYSPRGIHKEAIKIFKEAIESAQIDSEIKEKGKNN